MLYRTFDILISCSLLFLLWPLLIIIYLLLLVELGSPIFTQKRLGKDLLPFKLRKFRTMRLGTPSLGTHKVSSSSVTSSGKFLRRSKLDELPQLVNVIRGEMSLVGPRPCLLNQHEVINERRKLNVFSVKPGVTGLSQILDIDMSNPLLLATTDKRMIEELSIITYFRFLLKTVLGEGSGDRIKTNS